MPAASPGLCPPSSPKPFWLVALLLGLCTTMGCTAPNAGTRPKQAEPPQDLTNYLLVIQDTQEGEVTHAWVPNTGLAQRMPTTRGGSKVASDFQVILASQRPRDCNQEHHECYNRCKRRKPPYPYEYKKPSHSSYCSETCLGEFMECMKATGQHPVEFSETNEAIEWMKRHRKELAVGAVVVAAGVAFVVVSAGTGVLLLAPLAL